MCGMIFSDQLSNFVVDRLLSSSSTHCQFRVRRMLDSQLVLTQWRYFFPVPAGALSTTSNCNIFVLDSP
jgi:hypothetical protein